MTALSSELRLQWLSLSRNGAHIAITLPGLGSYLITEAEAGEVYKWLGVQLNG